VEFAAHVHLLGADGGRDDGGGGRENEVGLLEQFEMDAENALAQALGLHVVGGGDGAAGFEQGEGGAVIGAAFAHVRFVDGGGFAQQVTWATTLSCSPSGTRPITNVAPACFGLLRRHSRARAPRVHFSK
jgi:hypothetical protein